MARTFQPPSPALQCRLQAFGQRLKDARKGQHLSTQRFARELGISRDTLFRLELGHPSIALGTYARAMERLTVEDSIDHLAQPATSPKQP